MQQFACVQSNGREEAAYMPLHGFTAVDLGYQPGNAVSNIVNRFDETAFTATYLQLFDQIWTDPEKLEDVTTSICDNVAAVYKENSPEKIYFLMLYNIFNEFIGDVDEDVLPNDRTGYLETQVWEKLFIFQRDAAVGIVKKLETYNGCILADSAGLGKTISALAVVKYYELLPQIRYEMLRSARIGNASVAEACRRFGFSREYFYRLERSFKERGYVSLLGSRKGRRPVVTLNREIANYIAHRKMEAPGLSGEKFGGRFIDGTR